MLPVETETVSWQAVRTRLQRMRAGARDQARLQALLKLAEQGGDASLKPSDIHELVHALASVYILPPYHVEVLNNFRSLAPVVVSTVLDIHPVSASFIRSLHTYAVLADALSVVPQLWPAILSFITRRCPVGPLLSSLAESKTTQEGQDLSRLLQAICTFIRRAPTEVIPLIDLHHLRSLQHAPGVATRFHACHIVALCLSLTPRETHHLLQQHHAAQYTQSHLDLHFTIPQDTGMFLSANAPSAQQVHPRAIQPHIQATDSLSRTLTVVEDLFVACCTDSTANGDADNNSTTYKEGVLVANDTTAHNLRALSLAVSQGAPVLLEGPTGCGKTSLIRELARLTHNDELVYIHLGDQTDAKDLLGSYVCTDVPGEFRWNPGTLTQALTSGHWIVFEDIDAAPFDVLSILVPLLQKREVHITGRGEVIKAKSNFQLFATKTVETGRGESRDVLSDLMVRVVVDPLTADEIAKTVTVSFPQLQCIDRVIKLYHVMAAHELHPYSEGSVAYLANKVISHRSTRTVTLRDLLKLCRRIATLSPDGSDMSVVFAESLDCFAAHADCPEMYRCFAETIAQSLGISTGAVAEMVDTYKPHIQDTRTAVSVGRVTLAKSALAQQSSGLTSSSDRAFAFTRSALRTMEMLCVCVHQNEPVLLVGETGTGKTSVVQKCATLLGHKLVVQNLNQQTESGDLLGGYKPVDLHLLALPLVNRFNESLLPSTFSQKENEANILKLNQFFHARKWKSVIKLFTAFIKAALKREGAGNLVAAGEGEVNKDGSGKRSHAGDGDTGHSKKESSHSKRRKAWLTFADDVQVFRRQVDLVQNNFAFAFVPGILVEAVRNGWWILLDEINLASNETLERLSGLLEGSSGTLCLTERGDIERLERHPDFRLFACMNPPTDVGKKDLPPALKNRFSEIYVGAMTSTEDLLFVVNGYLQGLVPPKFPIDRIVNFYIRAREMAEDKLIDGANVKPRYNLRTLVRALEFTTMLINKQYTFAGALYESLVMSFATQLEAESRKSMMKLIMDCAQVTRPALENSPACPGPDHVEVSGRFWIQTPFDDASKIPIVDSQTFIATPSRVEQLRNLARVAVSCKFPVLLQGPTSSGKTSIVEHLAKITGHKFVRINNHEHTDIQEYIGTYTSNESGSLEFKDGLLVEAVRKGHWIVLDELNLAPSEVLEGLNRLLDDNRELFIPETQEVVKPHPHFLLFATQNPAGLYGGRKTLSRAFKNRFFEINFDDIPAEELIDIIHLRCKLRPKYCEYMVTVMRDLQRNRQSSQLFAGKQGFVTPRDLFRWAERLNRGLETEERLIQEGYIVLAERLRQGPEKDLVRDVLIKNLWLKQKESHASLLDHNMLYSCDSPEFKQVTKHIQESPRAKEDHLDRIVWTGSMRRMFTLVEKCLRHKEPVLLVGETGCGKTSICQLFAQTMNQRLHILNCHQHTETADFLGGLRPTRGREKLTTEAASVAQQLIERMQSESLSNVLPYPVLPSIDMNDVADLEKLSSHFAAHVEAVAQAALAAAAQDALPSFALDDARATLDEFRALISKIRQLFTWYDGPLIHAMKNGDMILVDEISLAEDAVLERLNSVLEPGRSLTLAEKGGDEAASIVAHSDFRIVATMNPGGDFGKKELSPALRSRFTEIWIPPVNDPSDVLQILEDRFDNQSFRPISKLILSFLDWFSELEGCRRFISLRDLLSWVDFINHGTSDRTSPLPLSLAYLHGACVVLLDGLGLNNSFSVSSEAELISKRDECFQFLVQQLRAKGSQLFAGKLDVSEELSNVPATLSEFLLPPQVYNWGDKKLMTSVQDDAVVIGDFSVRRGQETASLPKSVTWHASTTARHVVRVMRAMKLPKPILLEGSPGAGKTTLVAALAAATGNKLIRINLSEQTDIMDLLGSDLPSGDSSARYAWCDGALLQAVKTGAWVVLDELNLASQAVLEGLNALLDHRAEVFIPELGASYACASTFRIFACQNPIQQGGGRKGLPKSFVNRFTQIYIDRLSHDDLVYIAHSIYPGIPREIIASIVDFTTQLYDRTMIKRDFGNDGSPWEFNLRDVMRLCDCMNRFQGTGTYDPAVFVDLIFVQRMRTAADRQAVLALYKEVVGVYPQIDVYPSYSVNDLGWVQVGNAILPRGATTRSAAASIDSSSLMRFSTLNPLENIMRTVQLGSLAIVTGQRATGKTALVRLLADLVGTKLFEFSANTSTDALELLGGFEQLDIERLKSHLVKDILDCARDTLARSALNQGGLTAQDSASLMHLTSLYHTRASGEALSESGNHTKASHQGPSGFSEEALSLLNQIVALLSRDQQIETTRLSEELNQVQLLAQQGVTGVFEWIDSSLVEAVRHGHWYLIDNANFCNASVLDRLNPLLEPNGVLVLTERGMVGDGFVTLVPHPNFRLFFTMDPRHGEISSAMRNRGIEICLLDTYDSYVTPRDELALLQSVGITSPIHGRALVQFHDEIVRIAREVHATITIRDLLHCGQLVRELLQRDIPFAQAVEYALVQSYCKNTAGRISSDSVMGVYSEHKDNFSHSTDQDIQQPLVVPGLWPHSLAKVRPPSDGVPSVTLSALYYVGFLAARTCAAMTLTATTATTQGPQLADLDSADPAFLTLASLRTLYGVTSDVAEEQDPEGGELSSSSRGAVASVHLSHASIALLETCSSHSAPVCVSYITGLISRFTDNQVINELPEAVEVVRTLEALRSTIQTIFMGDDAQKPASVQEATVKLQFLSQALGLPGLEEHAPCLFTNPALSKTLREASVHKEVTNLDWNHYADLQSFAALILRFRFLRAQELITFQSIDVSEYQNRSMLFQSWAVSSKLLSSEQLSQHYVVYLWPVVTYLDHFLEHSIKTLSQESGGLDSDAFPLVRRIIYFRRAFVLSLMNEDVTDPVEAIAVRLYDLRKMCRQLPVDQSSNKPTVDALNDTMVRLFNSMGVDIEAVKPRALAKKMASPIIPYEETMFDLQRAILAMLGVFGGPLCEKPSQKVDLLPSSVTEQPVPLAQLQYTRELKERLVNLYIRCRDLCRLPVSEINEGKGVLQSELDAIDKEVTLLKPAVSLLIKSFAILSQDELDPDDFMTDVEQQEATEQVGTDLASHIRAEYKDKVGRTSKLLSQLQLAPMRALSTFILESQLILTTASNANAENVISRAAPIISRLTEAYLTDMTRPLSDRIVCEYFMRDSDFALARQELARQLHIRSWHPILLPPVPDERYLQVTSNVPAFIVPAASPSRLFSGLQSGHCLAILRDWTTISIRESPAKVEQMQELYALLTKNAELTATWSEDAIHHDWLHIADSFSMLLQADGVKANPDATEKALSALGDLVASLVTVVDQGAPIIAPCGLARNTLHAYLKDRSVSGGSLISAVPLKIWLTLLDRIWVASSTPEAGTMQHRAVCHCLLASIQYFGLCPGSIVDPKVKYSIRKGDVSTIGDGILLASEVRTDMEKAYRGSSNYAGLRDDTADLQRLGQELAGLHAKAVYRPPNKSFSGLYSACSSYSEVASVATIMDICDSVQMGSKDADMGISRVDMIQQASAAFLRRIEEEFQDFSDVTVPVAATVSHLRFGLDLLLASYKDAYIKSMSSVTVSELVSNLGAFPHTSESMQLLLSDQVQEAMLRLCRLHGRGDAVPVIRRQLLMAALFNTSVRIFDQSSVSETDLDNLNLIFTHIIDIWQQKEEAKKKAEAEKAALYKWKAEEIVIPTEDEVLEKQQKEMFPDYHKSFSKFDQDEANKAEVNGDVPEPVTSLDDDTIPDDLSFSTEQSTMAFILFQRIFGDKGVKRAPDVSNPPMISTASPSTFDRRKAFYEAYGVAATFAAACDFDVDANVEKVLLAGHLGSAAYIRDRLTQAPPSRIVPTAKDKKKSKKKKKVTVKEAGLPKAGLLACVDLEGQDRDVTASGLMMDIYRDPNVAEVQLIYEPLSNFLSRLAGFLVQWPAHPGLQQLAKLIEKLMSFPVTTPLMKILVGLELLLRKAAQWEMSASKEVSVQANIDEISALVKRWRKLELEMWPLLLDNRVEAAHVAGLQWWFLLYKTMNDQSGEDYNALFDSLDSFLRTSPLAEFELRLSIIASFEGLLSARLSTSAATATEEDEDREKDIMRMNMLTNIRAYYSQYLSAVTGYLGKERAIIEAELKEFTKLAKWDDLSYYGLEQIADKSHRKLTAHSKKFDDVLKQPVLPVLTSADSKFGYGSLSSEASSSPTTIQGLGGAFTELKLWNENGEDPEAGGLKLPQPQVVNVAKKMVNLWTSRILPSDKQEVLQNNLGDIASLCEDIIGRTLALRQETDKNHTQIKLRAVTDLLKAMKKLGLKRTHHPMEPRVLCGKSSLPDVRQSPVFASHSDDFDAISSYYFRCMARLWRLRLSLNAFGGRDGVDRNKVLMGASFVEDLYSYVTDHRVTLCNFIPQTEIFFEQTKALQVWIKPGVSGSMVNLEALQASSAECRTVQLRLAVFLKDLLAICDLSQFADSTPAKAENSVKDPPYGAAAVLMETDDLFPVKELHQLISSLESCSDSLQPLITGPVLDPQDIVRSSDRLIEVSEGVEQVRSSFALIKSRVPHLYDQLVLMCDDVTRGSHDLADVVDPPACADAPLDKSAQGSAHKLASSINDAVSSIMICVQRMVAVKEKNEDIFSLDPEEEEEYVRAGLISDMNKYVTTCIKALPLSQINDKVQAVVSSFVQWTSHPASRNFAAQQAICANVSRLVNACNVLREMLESFSKSFIFFHRSMSKLTYVTANIFLGLVTDGICLPPEESEAQDGDGDMNLDDDVAGTGLGEGEGKKDISDQLEDEAQTEGLKGEEEGDNQPDLSDVKNDEGIEMTTDFDAKAYDVEPDEEDQTEKDDKDDEEEDDEEELDREMGDLDQSDVVDEKMWNEDDEDEEDGKGKEEEKYEDNAPAESGPQEDELRGKDESEEQGPDKDKKKEEKGQEKGPEEDTPGQPGDEEGDDEDPAHDPDQGSDSDDEQPMPAEEHEDNHGMQLDEQKELELPDDLNLDGDDQDGGDEGGAGEEEPPGPDVQDDEMKDAEDKEGDDEEGEGDKEDEGQGDENEEEPEALQDFTQPTPAPEDHQEDPNQMETEPEETGDADAALDDRNKAKTQEDRMYGVEGDNAELDQDQQVGAQQSDKKDDPDLSEPTEEDQDNAPAAPEQDPSKADQSARPQTTNAEEEDEGAHQEAQRTRQDAPEEDHRRLGDATKAWKRLRMLDDAQAPEPSQNENVDMQQQAKEYQFEQGEGDNNDNAQDDNMQQTLAKAKEEDAEEDKPKAYDDVFDQEEKPDQPDAMDQDVEMEDTRQDEQRPPSPSKQTGSANAVNNQMTTLNTEDGEEGDEGAGDKANDHDSDAENSAADDGQDADMAPRDPEEEKKKLIISSGQDAFDDEVDEMEERLDDLRLPDGVQLSAGSAQLIADMDQALVAWRKVPGNFQRGLQAWRSLLQRTEDHARDFTERLRLILEPTLAAKLSGDFRTGKRINMKKVIPYIASQFKKDKIWLRRTMPSKRQYQVLLAIDDSESMKHNEVNVLAEEALALISTAMSKLEVGELAVMKFGQTAELVQPFHRPFTEASGAEIIGQFDFGQKDTNTVALLESVSAYLSEASLASSARVSPLSNVEFLQLVLIISDGSRLPKGHAKWIRDASEKKYLVVFVLVDADADSNSILQRKKISFLPGGKVKSVPALDEFPFPYYIIVRDVAQVPSMLANALRQWFEILQN